MDCFSLFHSVGFSVVVFLGSIISTRGTGLFYRLISALWEHECVRLCMHVLLWVGRGEVLARVQTSRVGRAKALSFLTKFCSTSWVNFFSAEPMLCRARVWHIPSDNCLVSPPQVHLAASMVTFPTGTVSGQHEHHGKAEPKRKMGCTPGWGGRGKQGCPLLVGGSVGEGGLSVSLCLLFASVSLKYLEGKEEGSWKCPAPLKFRELPSQHPRSTWEGHPACAFLAFAWCRCLRGDTRLRRPWVCPRVPVMLSSSQLKLTPLFSLTCSCSSSVLGGGMLRIARKGVSLVRWVLLSAQGEGGCDLVCNCRLCCEERGSPAAAWYLMSKCFCDTCAGVSEQPPLRTEMVLKIESKWELICCLLVRELYVSKLMVKWLGSALVPVQKPNLKGF